MKKHSFFDAFKRGGSRFENDAFDPELWYPAIRSSICTGEKVAGFRNKKDGHFTEVMLIRSQKDLDEFKSTYKVDDIKVEY